MCLTLMHRLITINGNYYSLSIKTKFNFFSAIFGEFIDKVLYLDNLTHHC